ncbi:MAG: YXWGXW repeat-containing protein [Rhodanobacter sp.]
MSLRRVALSAVVTATALTAGCVVEQPVYHHPRPVIVEQPQVVEVIAPQPPPVQIVEEIPPPRPGYVWARGYWHWNGQRYVVMHGHWEQGRPGYHYVHPHWEQRNDGWHLHVGVWVAG